MKRRDASILVVMAIVVGAVAFWIGRTTAVGQKSRECRAGPRWLRNAPAEAVQAEQDFQRQVRRLTDAARAEQATLVSILADLRFTDEQVLAQVDSAVGSHAALMRSVGRHLVQLRGSLPESQERDLMRSCAHSLQGCVERRYRWRGGAQGEDGGAPGRGGGRGAGYGRQYRGGRGGGYGLARRLQLTPEQIVWVQQHDPDFDGQCALLKDRLREAHVKLIASFEDEQVTDEALLAAVDALVEAHNSLEKRVARHVVLLRPHLSEPQRERLSGLCIGGPESRTGGPVSTNRGGVDAFDIAFPSGPVPGVLIRRGMESRRWRADN